MLKQHLMTLEKKLMLRIPLYFCSNLSLLLSEEIKMIVLENGFLIKISARSSKISDNFNIIDKHYLWDTITEDLSQNSINRIFHTRKVHIETNWFPSLQKITLVCLNSEYTKQKPSVHRCFTDLNTPCKDACLNTYFHTQ